MAGCKATIYHGETMITEIGVAAGEIWGYLDKHGGEASLNALVSSINAPKETILMAAGWLAREGYIFIEITVCIVISHMLWLI